MNPKFYRINIKSGKIKLYADENIEDYIINYLKSRGINIVSAKGKGYSGRSDKFQFQQAYKLKRFLLTIDKDFLKHSKFPFKQMRGLILLNIPDDSRKLGYVYELLITEILPSGNDLIGTKIVINWNSIELFYISDNGKIEHQIEKYQN